MLNHKVGYTGGINKDVSKSKYPNTHYFDATNIKIVTDAGNSTGSIENEKGNKLLFSFPDIGIRYKVTTASANIVVDGNTVAIFITDTNEQIYNKLIANSSINTLFEDNDIYIFFNDTGVYIQILDTSIVVTGTVSAYFAAITRVYICGWCRLNEWIIVFTSNGEGVDPIATVCQIWKFKFEEGSRTQIDSASGTVLIAKEHLIYNETLKFSTATYIRDTVANYESNTKGRVYFTDFYNQIRVANVFDDELMSLKPTDLDLISEVTLSKPNIKTIENTGFVPVGITVQYFYKLLDTDGRETTFSPGSQIIDLQETLSSDLGTSHYGHDSTPAGTANNKSLTIVINDIDTDYDTIELYAVIWETLDTPSVYKVLEKTVDNETEQLTHSTMENAINIPFVSFMDAGIPFTAKTLDNKDKVLVAGNIKESTFDIEFDARAYRFNTDATPNFDLFEADGSSVNYTAATMNTVPETSDAINPTNDDSNTTYNVDNITTRQIYKSDGTTIGGEGPNVEYGFVTNARIGSSGSKSLHPEGYTPTAGSEGYNRTDTRAPNPSEYNLGEQNLDGTTFIEYDLSNELNSTKSNKINAVFTGGARGEVYRYGVLFLSKQGQRSFVKWIGDIKFPEPFLSNTYKVSDVHSSITLTNSTANIPSDSGYTVDTYTYDLGLSITIDISSIKSEISGYKFVRVERTVQDRTRLGTGVVTNFVDYLAGNSGNNNTKSVLKKYANDNTILKTISSNNGNTIVSTTQVFGTNYGDGSGTDPKTVLLINDHPDILYDANNHDITAPPVIGFRHFLLNFTAPSSEFRTYTEFSVNESLDYIRDYGYYSTVEDVYNDDFLNPEAGNNNMRKTQLGILYRAKKFVSLSSEGQVAQNYKIEDSRLMTDGEFIINDGSILDTIPAESLIGEYEAIINSSYTFKGVNSDEKRPFGIGTQKQLLRIEETSTVGWGTDSDDLNTKVLDSGDVLATASSAFPTNLQEYKGSVRYFKEVAYCRLLSNQYGGNSYEARSKNSYIDTGHYQIVNSNSPNTFTASVYGGDTYVLSYDREYIRQYWTNPTENQFKDPGDDEETKMSIGFVFCAECPINTSFRTGEHFGGESEGVTDYFRGSISTALTKGDLSITEAFTFDERHKQSNNSRTDYIAQDFLSQSSSNFPMRIRVSETKIDGEFTDSWRKFPVNQFDDVKGSLGQINKIISFQDNLFYFQDRAIGTLPINERAVIEDVTGAELILGNGNLIGKYRYLDETSGTKHQHSVIATGSGIYYFDSLQHKIMLVKNGSLTENLGLHSFFHNEILESLRTEDELYVSDPIGVHSIYDKKNERVIFTFLGANKIVTLPSYMDVGQITFLNSKYYQCLVQGNYTTNNVSTPTLFYELSNYRRGFTLSFNEKLKAFESFHTYRTGNFLSFDDKLLSVSSEGNRNNGYIQEEGNYGLFYDNYFPSDITLIVIPNPDLISKFTNIEYYSEITINRENVVGDTLDTILVWNNHQNTGEVTLTVGTLAIQRLQTWRHKLKRDLLGTNLNAISKPHIRNYYCLLKLRYDNSSNKRLVLSDINIGYIPTRL